jgi:hypothetical protein
MSEYDERVKAVPMTREVVEPLFRGDMAMVCGMPDDARFVRFYNEPRRDLLMFVFESEEFDIVEEGAVIPEKDAVVKEIDADVRTNMEYITPRR